MLFRSEGVGVCEGEHSMPVCLGECVGVGVRVHVS